MKGAYKQHSWLPVKRSDSQNEECRKKEGLSLLCTTVADSYLVHDSDGSIALIVEQPIIVNGCHILTDHRSIGFIVYHKNGVAIDASHILSFLAAYYCDKYMIRP